MIATFICVPSLRVADRWRRRIWPSSCLGFEYFFSVRKLDYFSIMKNCVIGLFRDLYIPFMNLRLVGKELELALVRNDEPIIYLPDL